MESRIKYLETNKTELSFKKDNYVLGELHREQAGLNSKINELIRLQEWQTKDIVKLQKTEESEKKLTITFNSSVQIDPNEKYRSSRTNYHQNSKLSFYSDEGTDNPETSKETAYSKENFEATKDIIGIDHNLDTSKENFLNSNEDREIKYSSKNTFNYSLSNANNKIITNRQGENSQLPSDLSRHLVQKES